MTTDVQAPGHRGSLVSHPGATSRAPAETFTTLTKRHWIQSSIVFVAAALLLIVADILFIWFHPGTHRIDIGNFRDKFFLTQVNYQEVDDQGITYRWTSEQSTIWITEIGNIDHALFTLELGGRPEPVDVQLTLNDEPWVELVATEQPRVYTLVMPPDLPEQVRVGISSPTFTVAGDPRQLGIKIEGFSVTLPRESIPLPTFAQYFAQLVIILAAQLTVIRLGWAWRKQAILVGVLAIALAALLSFLLLLTYAYIPRLAVASVALAVLTWGLLPVAERRLAWMDSPGQIRLLWTIMIIACAVRLIGVTYTTFGSQDLGINLDRLYRTFQGEMIIIKGSHEFADGLTLYPTGPYLSVAIGATFLSDYPTLMHGALALLDGTTVLLVAILTRSLGGNREASWFAMVLYAGSISAFGTMSYGFQQQIFSQWFTIPIILLLFFADTPPRPRTWILATVLLLFAVFSHIGVAILYFTWFGFIGLLMLIAYRGFNRSWWLGASLTIASVVLAFGFLYVDIFASKIDHLSHNVVSEEPSTLFPGATPLLMRGLRLGYSDAGLALLPLGSLLIWWANPSFKRVIVLVALILTVFFYLIVDLLTALQVRYFYFALPLVLAAIGIALGYLSTYSRWIRWGSWLFVLSIALQSTALWFMATFANGKISMTPLTH